MKAILRSMALAALLLAGAGAARAAEGACPALLNHSFARLQDEAPQPQPQSLCQYKGKVVLVVNTASYCGFTGQYDGLEKMYAKYREQGLVVIGFPSNDFGSQEPGSNKEIAEFCRLTYGVKFPMFAKSDVVGAAANPLYRQLAAATGEKPKWNFHKYLIDRSGQKVMSFPSTTAPDSRTFVAAVEKALAERP
ncbi:MAG TPA: glutathione peroxidase [Zoogloea sp.]|uniref:glutathione peroxidase n=1 Tax=Zoogloea sp. TaxID=49181 RepID=UPI002C972961|nr:glutathione peroxidase [Zoogloea sp.]HOB45707.1 glutathione peroxidase [Zoogloea sp.]HQA09091.1 glutathione peroxidase [Zoogloea sp.]HQE37822.1 glutathione peroxidase [Zoogloea sp.]